MGLLEALKQYASDAAGGSLNPEVGNTLSGLLNYGKDRAKYIGGLLDDSSPINKDFKNWHDRTQLGLADLIAGKEGPQADYGYSQIMNMAGVAPLGVTAWHGSPHKFDKFSLDKIGTGEGAQAYGHGLYLAESPEVAKSYKAETAFKYGQRDMADMLYSQKMGDVDKAIASLKPEIAQYEAKGWPTPEYKQQYLDAVKKLEGYKVQPPDVGQLYKTDIPDEAVARFLDWDKPLSQQAPEVQAAVDTLGLPSSVARDVTWGGPATRPPQGMEVYSAGRQKLGEREFSEAMRKAGVPGIRYLDGGSRSAGQGSSNFVLFDPEMIRILERNGQPTGQHPWALGEWLKRQK